MGMGKNQSESSQEFDPQLKEALLSVFGEGQRLYNNLAHKPYQYATTAPMSPFQQEGLDMALTNARGQIGNDQLNAANTALTGVTNYNPDTLTSQQISGVPQAATTQVGTDQVSNIQQILANQIDDVGQVGTSRVGTSQVRANDISDIEKIFTNQISNVGQVAGQTINPMALLNSDQVNAQRFADTSLDPYTNQYENQVVNQTISDIDRARQMQQNQNNAAAVSAGAFGGDRQAIQRAETDRNALEATAREVGQLRQGGYEAAAQRAEGDITRNLTGQQSNQASNMAAGQFNIGNEFSRQQANQARDLTQSQANASNSLARQRANQASNLAARTSNAANSLTRQQSNQSANLRAMEANARNTLDASRWNASNALDASRYNAANSLARQQSNQASNLTADQTNAGNDLIGQQANQTANLQASQSNANNALNASTANALNNLNMQRYNQADQMQAGMNNQNAGLSNQQFQLGAANQLAGLGGDYRNFANQDAQNILGVGNFQQGQAQNILDDQSRRYQQEQEYAFRMFDLLRGAAGILPNPLTSSSESSGWNASMGG
mgnify:FL=1|jgi:hypothetical protein